MNPTTGFIALMILMLVATVGVFLITRAIYRKKVKDAISIGGESIRKGEREKEELQKIINEKNAAITKVNGEFEELKKQHQEVQDKCTELQKVDQDAVQIEEENEQAFAGLKMLLEEAEATNEILLKHVTGELTKEEALTQISALAPKEEIVTTEQTD